MSQCTLGKYYLLGRGCEMNPLESFKCFQRAAIQNYAEAQYWLGYCYSWGIGVEKNIEEANKWYKKAEELGFKK